MNQPSFRGGLTDRRNWLSAFGVQFRRIEYADVTETECLWGLAEAIATTSWIHISQLEVVLYLNGVLVGAARLTDVLWADRDLLIAPLSRARLAASGDDEGIDPVAEDTQFASELIELDDIHTRDGGNSAMRPELAPPAEELDPESIKTKGVVRPRAAPKPPRPSVMTRFALTHGSGLTAKIAFSRG